MMAMNKFIAGFSESIYFGERGEFRPFGGYPLFQVIFAVEVRESNFAWGETMATMCITFGGQTY